MFCNNQHQISSSEKNKHPDKGLMQQNSGRTILREGENFRKMVQVLIDYKIE